MTNCHRKNSIKPPIKISFPFHNKRYSSSYWGYFVKLKGLSSGESYKKIKVPSTQKFGKMKDIRTKMVKNMFSSIHKMKFALALTFILSVWMELSEDSRIFKIFVLPTNCFIFVSYNNV